VLSQKCPQNRCFVKDLNMAALPQFIPLPKAAEQLEMREDELRRLVDSGKIDAIALPDGDVAISEKDMTEPLSKEDLPEYKKYKELSGVGIGINEAANKYNIPFSTLRGWVLKGYIEKVGRQGQKILINEQDAAYCADIYERRGGQGKWLFNPDGTPYELKH
jgi:predicted site-specific integrase-resolvase